MNPVTNLAINLHLLTLLKLQRYEKDIMDFLLLACV